MRKIAVTGGIGYLVIFVTGVFANFIVLEALKVPGDWNQTVDNFLKNSFMFKLAIVAFILMTLADLLLTWVLDALFKESNAQLSKLTAWMRLINVALFGVALTSLVSVYSSLTVDFPSQELLIYHISSEMNSFDIMWLIGLIFFGTHLILLAILLKGTGKIHWLIWTFLLIAGFGYLIDSALQLIYDAYSVIADWSVFIVILPGVIGELSLTCWLLIKGGRNSKTSKS